MEVLKDWLQNPCHKKRHRRGV